MKKIILSIIAGLLAVTMMMSLSACSIDINTGSGNDPIHIDLDDISLDGIDLDEIKEAISDSTGIDVDELKDSFTEKAQDILGEVQESFSEKSGEISGVISNILDRVGVDGENIAGIISQFAPGSSSGENAGDQSEEGFFNIDIDEDIDIEDIKDMDTDELLAMIKSVLEANGMGDYYDMIAEQLENNPEWVQQIIEQYGGEDLSSLFN